MKDLVAFISNYPMMNPYSARVVVGMTALSSGKSDLFSMSREGMVDMFASFVDKERIQWLYAMIN